MTVKELRVFDRLVYQQDNCRIFHCSDNVQRLEVMDVMTANCLQWILVGDYHPDENDYFLIYFL